jgi:site-specific DNA-methyltransferase (adenine-specific)
VIVGDIWVDIDRLNQTAQERLGYPTQKPMELLERIICASTNEGETILDPFYGYGTTIDSPQCLKRKWVGIDVTYLAIGLIKSRLRGAYGDHIKETYVIRGEPIDLSGAKSLAQQDPFQFQSWALGLVGARGAAQKKGADKGIEGNYSFTTVTEARRKKLFSPSSLDI